MKQQFSFPSILLSFCFLLPSAAAFAGETEVQGAVVLIKDNQERAKQLGSKHVVVIRDTRIELSKGVGVRFEPGGHEAELFEAEGGAMTRQAVGQLVIIRRILARELRSPDMKVASAAAIAGRLADTNEAYLTKAVESAALDLSFERMLKELSALEERYENQKKLLPPWTLNAPDKNPVDTYHKEITEVAAKVVIELIPGKSGPMKLPGLGEGRMTAEEYAARKQALEAKKAEEARHREQRLAEIRQREKEKGPEPDKLAKSTVDMSPLPPPLPRDHEKVATWHLVYTTKIVRFKKMLALVLGTRDRSRKTVQLAERCIELGNASTALLADTRLPSGAPAVDTALHEVLEDFERAARACTAGKMDELEVGIKAGEAALGRFAEALALYRLNP